MRALTATTLFAPELAVGAAYLPPARFFIGGEAPRLMHDA
jgi:hypothetical protein